MFVYLYATVHHLPAYLTGSIFHLQTLACIRAASGYPCFKYDAYIIQLPLHLTRT